MALASRWFLLIPFKEFVKRLKHLGQEDIEDESTRRVFDNFNVLLKEAGDREFENYKAIERWANNFPVPPIQTFHRIGALATDESETYWVPELMPSALLTGGLTVYGSGTVTATLNQNGTAVATLTMTSTGLYTTECNIQWKPGDGMSAEVTGAGTGCEGLVLQVLR